MTDEELQNNELYSDNMFESEQLLIDKELEELDSLYDEIKTHYDKVKNSPARGSLTFLEKQTSNLISLKQAKLSYISKKTDLKKTIADFAFKDKQIKTKEGEDVDAITESIFKRISEEFVYNKNDENIKKIDDEDDEDLDNELDDILEKNNIDISDIVADSIKQEEVDNSEDEEESDNIIKTDTVYNESDGNFYLVYEDEEGNLVIEKELGVIDTISEFYTEEYSGIKYAVSAEDSSKIYEVVTFE